MARIYDISWLIHEDMPVYPGDFTFSREEKRSGDFTHSQMSLGTHTGTHVDVPKHLIPQGKSIDEMSLEVFVGPCRVLDMTHVLESIEADDLHKADIKKGERVLVKTRNSRLEKTRWHDDYVYLGSEAAELLADKGIALFGIDYLSVQKRESSDNRPHSALLGKGIPIIEGLDLSEVSPGAYELVCLPLRIKNGDGAPARTILIDYSA